MKRYAVLFLAISAMLLILAGDSCAGSSKTWSNIGKGLAIYEGYKVLTGKQGNIVDDVTGGIQPRGASSQESAGSGTYQDGYNAGYKSGYDAGYNAGFRQGVETTAGNK